MMRGLACPWVKYRYIGGWYSYDHHEKPEYVFTMRIRTDCEASRRLVGFPNGLLRNCAREPEYPFALFLESSTDGLLVAVDSNLGPDGAVGFMEEIMSMDGVKSASWVSWNGYLGFQHIPGPERTDTT